MRWFKVPALVVPVVAGGLLLTGQLSAQPRPAVTIDGPERASVGEQVTFAIAGTPGQQAGFSQSDIIWNFGDDTVVRAGTTVTHTYTAAGEYTVTASAGGRTGRSRSRRPGRDRFHHDHRDKQRATAGSTTTGLPTAAGQIEIGVRFWRRSERPWYAGQSSGWRTTAVSAAVRCAAAGWRSPGTTTEPGSEQPGRTQQPADAASASL